MPSENISIYIDETGVDENSTILAIACIITREPSLCEKRLDSLKLDLLKDKRFRDIPSIGNLKTKGFHYCEDHQDVIPEVIRLIAELPFDAYIYYIHKKSNFSPSDGFDWYDQLFGKLMHNRLQKYRKSSIRITFEQHGKSFTDREQQLKSIVERLISEIKLKDVEGFSGSTVVKSAGKEESCLALADYVAAVFKNYEELLKKQGSKLQSNSTSWQARHFSMLSPKIRVIHNFETDEFFTRNNPFP